MRWLTDNVAGGWSLWRDKVSAAQCGLPLRRQRLAIKHILLIAFSDVLSPSPLPPLPPRPPPAEAARARAMRRVLRDAGAPRQGER
eukprot:4543606-Pyramimonas_sp.AAC.1